MGISLALLAATLLAISGCTASPPTATPPTKATAAPVVFVQSGRIAVRLESGETAFLTTGPTDMMPSVSPDSRMVAFVAVGSAGRAGTYVVNMDATDEHQVAPSAAMLSRPAWSPDGRRLALRDTTKDGMGIWTVDADGKNLQRIFTGEALSPVWSPDGKSIAFTSGNSTKDGAVQLGLYLADPDGKSPRLVAQGWYGELAWSPNGKQLAVVASPKDAPRALLTVGVAGGDPITITTNLAEGTWAPTWSPDGKSIAFVVNHEDGQHLAVIPAGGGPTKMLVHGKSFSTPVWAASGDHLVVARDIDGSRSHRLIQVGIAEPASIQELGNGETPGAIAGSPTKPTSAVAARPQVEGMRRADLLLASGSWG